MKGRGRLPGEGKREVGSGEEGGRDGRQCKVRIRKDGTKVKGQGIKLGRK